MHKQFGKEDGGSKSFPLFLFGAIPHGIMVYFTQDIRYLGFEACCLHFARLELAHS